MGLSAKLLGTGIVSIGVGLLLAACFGCEQAPPPPPPPPSKIEKTAPPPPKDQAGTAAEEKKKPEYTYDPNGRREPFKSLIVEQVPKAEDAVVTPRPEDATSPLQQFDLEQLKLSGILLGGLGDYARVIAPDGKSYTINVGTLLGKHTGKVISISEDAVVVKETIRYESGKIEEKETSIAINPMKEGKKP